jgi:hypothetical protein
MLSDSFQRRREIADAIPRRRWNNFPQRQPGPAHTNSRNNPLELTSAIPELNWKATNQDSSLPGMSFQPQTIHVDP